MSTLPSHATYVIIGAGIHGLSTGMHLAQRLRSQGKTVGANGIRIVVLDKENAQARKGIFVDLVIQTEFALTGPDLDLQDVTQVLPLRDRFDDREWISTAEPSPATSRERVELSASAPDRNVFRALARERWQLVLRRLRTLGRLTGVASTRRTVGDDGWVGLSVRHVRFSGRGR